MFEVLKDKLGNIIDPHIPRYDNLSKYSTDEIKTGKTWIDDKPIYRKCFQQTSTATIHTGISNIDSVIEMKCFVRNTHDSSGAWRPIPNVAHPVGSYTDWVGGFYLSASSGNISNQRKHIVDNVMLWQ